jgi:DNA-binding NarL/FixJ family response regulator
MGKDSGEPNLGGRVPALIVAEPGPLRDGLQVLVTAIPRVEVVGRAGDVALALRLLAEHRPTLVLLDASLRGDGDWSTLRRIKLELPQVRCIALVDDAREQERARSAGAAAAVLKGFPAAKLVEAIETLLPRQEESLAS